MGAVMVISGQEAEGGRLLPSSDDPSSIPAVGMPASSSAGENGQSAFYTQQHLNMQGETLNQRKMFSVLRTYGIIVYRETSRYRRAYSIFIRMGNIKSVICGYTAFISAGEIRNQCITDMQHLYLHGETGN